MTIPQLQNPFVGLRPYESDESLFYFGRSEQTKTLLRLLYQHRFVAVVGSSGAGKSSLIRAGLIPQLEAGFLVQERDQWLVAATKPGDAPLSNLVNSLLVTLNTNNDSANDKQDREQLISEINENGSQALMQRLESALSESDNSLFILVDQFEELFRFGLEKGQTKKRRQAEQFVALLLSLSRHDLPIYVCLTMRSDFLGDCDAFYGLPEAINKSQFLVPRLSRSQRQDVITHPINLASAKISPRLVDKLLNENIDTRDDLPILQHALMRTWDEWQAQGAQGPLDIEHYEKTHTIHESLDRHADEALQELKTEEQQNIAKVLFQALTTVDAGNRRIRRPVHLNEVSAVANASPQAVMAVIDCFREKNRSFLVLSSPAIESNPLIDISHESLIRQWKTLDGWVDKESEAAGTYKRLVATSQRYNNGKADLLHGIELEEAEIWKMRLLEDEVAQSWAKRYDNNFAEANEFLQLSKAAYVQEKVAEEEARDYQEKLLTEKAELEEQKRILAEKRSAEQQKSLTKTRWLSGLMALLTIAMLAVAGYAMNKSNTATAKALEANYNLAKTFEEKSKSSIARGNASFASKKTDEYRDALLYLLEAQRLPLAEGKTAISQASLNEMANLDYSILRSPNWENSRATIVATNAIAYRSDGKFIASGSNDNIIRLWNPKFSTGFKALKGHSRAVFALAYSPNGKLIASGSNDTDVRLWNAQSGQAIKTLEGHTESVKTIAFSPDGKIIASGSNDSTIRLWGVQADIATKILEDHTGSVNAITYSPYGKVIASGSNDNSIRLWDVQSGKTIKILKGHTSPVNTVAYSPDGKFIASGSGEMRTFGEKPVPSDNTIRLWDAQTGKLLNTLKGHSDLINAVAFSPDGKVIASGSGERLGSGDNTIRLWDVQSGEAINTIKGHSGSFNTIAYSPDGKVIASGSNDNSIRLSYLRGARYRFIHDFDAAEVSGALRFVWERQLVDLTFQEVPRAKAMPGSKYSQLLEKPRADETKIDQVVRWLEERCAYKQPERYGCTYEK